MPPDVRLKEHQYNIDSRLVDKPRLVYRLPREAIKLSGIIQKVDLNKQALKT